ncbi:hypothetical protein DPMN_123502 [Dreissena polymorpha]|uniref:Uncharacterized protein n=1 Tax=Dreissena polymorpha TaxID=45954 RepID=A0A9D4JRC6_DREPO|nr:hypothetical protein DPMN_123502 [Dreissena polymorpha]
MNIVNLRQSSGILADVPPPDSASPRIQDPHRARATNCRALQQQQSPQQGLQHGDGGN